MFEKYKARKAAKEYQDALAKWQTQRDGYAGLLEVAESFNGVPTDEIMLKAGEALFFKVERCALVEERRGQGHYQGGSTGVSIPIGSLGGRSVRYRVGATRGHYVQGTPVPTAIDVGSVYITNQRVVFAGNKQTRECLFAKTIGIAHDDSTGETTISVSNRQKPTVVHYGPAIAGDVDFRLELAVAHFKGTVPQLIDQMRAQLDQIEAERPRDPTGAGLASLPPPPLSTSLPPPPPSTAPPPPPPPRGPVIPPADHEAGWEYVYFASEIARGIQECQPRYLEYQSQMSTGPGESVADPAAHIRVLSDEISAAVAQVDQVLDPASLELAFGPPGVPGDEAAIRSAAARLCALYAEMIDWGIKVRSANVAPTWQPVYAALARYVSLPLHQFQDFSATLSAAFTQMATDIRAGKTPSNSLTMTLKLTIDPNATAEFDAALAAARAGR